MSVSDQIVRIWDVTIGETVRTFRVPGFLDGVALSPNGRMVALGSNAVIIGGQEHRSILLVGWESGQVEKVLRGHEGQVHNLLFSRDGARLAAAGMDRKIRIWDVQTGKMEHVLEGHARELQDIAFSPDRKRLLSIGQGEPQARIWSLTTGKTDTVIEGGDWQPRSAAWSPDGKTLAITTAAGDVTLWGPNGVRREPRISLGAVISSVTFTPDSREMLVTSWWLGEMRFRENLCSMVDVASGKERIRFPLHTGPLDSGTISHDGKLAASCGGSRHEIHVWRTADGSPLAEMTGKGSGVGTVVWGVDGRSISWGPLQFLRRSFHLDKLEFGPPTPVFIGPRWRDGNRTLELNAEGRMLIKQDGQLLHSYLSPWPGNSIRSFTWVAGSRVVVVNSMDVVLLDGATGKEIRKYNGQWGAAPMAPSPDGKLFVTGGQDQTIRIWDVERETPLLSFFFTDQDWVAWTEEGIYAASPGGERLIGWQIGHNLESLSSFYPAVQFHKSRYFPEVIRELLPTRSLTEAWAKAGKKGPIGDVVELQPPEVSITSPAGVGTVRVAEGKFEVKATANSRRKNPVTALRLLVNGRPYQGESSLKPVAPPQLGSVSVSWNVQLAPGPYTLAVVAESTASRSMSAPVEVMVGSAPGTQPKLYVLAVGINAYPGDMRLRYAAPDADALTETLRQRSTKTFRDIEIRVLKDKEATRKGIEEGLAWLRSKMTMQDIGIVSFSGHGHRALDGQFYLIPVDADPRAVRTSCISGDELKRTLGEMPGRIIAILDACHSGAAAKGPELRQEALADDFVRDLVSDDYGIIVYSSSQGREYSLEDPEYRQGLFTFAILEALKGEANLRADGLVFLNELELYARKRVRVLSSGVQNPVMIRPAAVRSFALSQADPTGPRPPPIVATPGSKTAACEAYEKGTALAQQGKRQEAIQLFDEAIRLDPRLQYTYGNRAISRRELRQYDLAIQDTITALTLDPDYAKMWWARGGIRVLQHRHADAVRDLTQALRISPGSREVLQMRGESFFALKLWEQAIQDFDEVIRSNPRHSELIEKRGLCHLQLRHWDAALADFDCVVLLDPKDPDGYGERARVYAAQGKHAEAVRELELCRKLNPEIAKQHEKLAYPNGRPKP